MRTYQNKSDLKKMIQLTFQKYLAEFEAIPEEQKDQRIEGVDRTPAENLAYQVGWTNLLLKWEADESAGKIVVTPTEQYKWNQLGELYQWFNDTYSSLTLAALKEQLTLNVDEICEWIENLSEEELFSPHQRQWADNATKTAVWEVYKFIHINTVAPFGTFRTKIRKWKKLAG
ncbi:ClbS/DfsB family four-helix bundle protein [Enterococcus camelliae]|uniref:ClbS/DfsB family four-helix bundle protein n=1 Tax=Enterococcus camelliae TaxID=453959 RepID=A0ABW5TI58_9ENTE